MSDLLVIPKDLEEEYADVCGIVEKFFKLPDYMSDYDTKAWAGNALATKQHIERIARLEAENVRLRAQVERPYEALEGALSFQTKKQRSSAAALIAARKKAENG